MTKTSTALVIRQQAWFRAHVEVDNLEPFPADAANVVTLLPAGQIHARVLIGRGPLQHDLQPIFLSWFDHGEEQYPVLECPSTGPKGAGLHASTSPGSLSASDKEVVVLVEISVVQPVDPVLAEQYRSELQAQLGLAGGSLPVASVVSRLLVNTSARLDQAVGLYALYQYPVVWEPIVRVPLVAFADLEAQTIQQLTPIVVDNFIPFRLNVSAKVQHGQLIDDGLVDLHRLPDGELHLPLVLLQRMLWQRNVQVRFLECFWIIEHLAGRFADKDIDREKRTELYAAIERCVQKELPDQADRISRLKHLIIQRPLRERLEAYFTHWRIPHDNRLIVRMLKLRNALAHGSEIDTGELATVELETRVAVRQIMQKELAARGVGFALAPTESVD